MLFYAITFGWFCVIVTAVTVMGPTIYNNDGT